MKLLVLQEDLSSSLSNVVRFTSIRAQLPILGNIVLSAKNNKLFLLATNLESSISISVPAKIEAEGDISIPGKTLTEMVSQLPKQAIGLKADKEELEISTENFNSVIAGMNASEFPKVPQTVNKEKSIILGAKTLSNAISKVSFCVSQDETRPVLTGLLFSQEGSSLSLVATDGFRLSKKTIDQKIPGGFNPFILPRNSVFELARFPEAQEVVLEQRGTENQIVFGAGGYVVSSRVIDGEFPDYTKIIPKEVEFEIIISHDELLRAIKIASVFARESSNVVAFSVSSDSLELSSEEKSRGSQKVKLESSLLGDKKAIPGGSFRILFNYRFVEEFLNATEGEEVKIGFTSSSSPGRFLDPADANLLYLIMPVNLEE